jgi:hypothetical protein
MARRQVGAIHCAHPSGLIVRSSPQHRGPSSASMTAIVASLEARSSKGLRPSRAQEARKGGPSNTASGRRKSPKDGPQDAGQFAAGTGMCLRRTPAAAREPGAQDVRRACSRGGLLFGDFLLAKQEKVARAPGRGAEQDRDVERDGAMTLGFPRVKPVGSPTYTRRTMSRRGCRTFRQLRWASHG